MNKEEIINKILKINNFPSLNPMQVRAKEFIGENTLISTPTASGKTTVFEMFMYDTIVNKKKKVIYISPLKALTSEHYKDIKKKYEKELNIKVGISTGDLDGSIKRLENYDVLFLTFEKFDSVLRRSPSWLKEIGLVTIDEIHEIGNDRGVTLEIIITQLKQKYKNTKILGLSATIGNARELSEWLGAKLVESHYRPVPLKVGVFLDNKIYFEDDEIILKNEPAEDIRELVYDTLKQNKQAIVFCNSRASAVNMAKKYSRLINQTLDEKERIDLKKIATDIGEALTTPTKQCLNLYTSVINGCAFHHAGLIYKQREIIENEFKNRAIKIIFATPTLAAGINLPAFRVIINTIYRYSGGGLNPIPINEFWQMCGRAGRPKFDDSGEAIVYANSEKALAMIFNNYVMSSPTDIESQLQNPSLLRQQLLSIILTNGLKNKEEILDYFSHTFYSYKSYEKEELEENISETLSLFVNYELLKEEDRIFEISEVGKKTCYLYFDPLSANNILRDLNLKSKNKKELSELSLLFTLVNTSELFPYMRFRKELRDRIFSEFEEIKDEVYFSYEDLELLEKTNLTYLLNDWINEATENDLNQKYNVSPGQLQEILNKINWILHGTLEFSKLISLDSKIYKRYLDLELRLKYGVKPELLELVQLRNIGKKRARKLFISGIKSIADVKKDPDRFVEVVGRFGLDALKELNIPFEFKDKKEKVIKTIFDY